MDEERLEIFGTGTREEKRFKKNIDNLVENIQNEDDDLVIIFGGKTGTGKSTVVMFCFTYLMQKIHKARATPEDLKKYIAWGIYSYFKKSYQYRYNPYTMLWFDEGVQLFFGREAMHEEHIDLGKFFNINRKYNHIYFVCIPSIFRLDPIVREERVKLLILTGKDPDSMYFDESGKKRFERFIAFYSGDKYLNLITNERLARKYWLRPHLLIREKGCKPDFIFYFPKYPNNELWQEYVHLLKDEYMEREHKKLIEKYEKKRLVQFEFEDIKKFLYYISRYFRMGDRPFLFFKQETLALLAGRQKKTINDLVKKLRSEGYIQHDGQMQYTITQNGQDAIKEIEEEMQGKVEVIE